MKLSKPILITIATALALLIGLGIFWYMNSREDTVKNEDSINYGPPTETEISETNQHKENLAEELSEDEQNENQTGDNGNKRSVTPIISFWSQQSDGSDLELNGYVAGITEKDGRCTATLIKDQETVKESKVALEYAQTTSCGLIVVPRSELSAGEWQLTLSYSSSASAGSSEGVKVTIK